MVERELSPTGLLDPRALLAEWANSNDEWVRLLVAEVLVTSRPAGEAVIDSAYQLLRQEKALDERELPTVENLNIEARQDEAADPLKLVRLCEVHGVNALVPGAVIEPHEALTILYGENGTGKTGYSRIFKALADSRTADEILGNIDAEAGESQSAHITYLAGETEETLEWTGNRGISPFTRMSIFDSPCVTAHVDDDLDYVYVPATLALFNHVIAAVQGVAVRIEAAMTALGSSNSNLLSRFQRGSKVYPLIETLGAATDLAALKTMAIMNADVDLQIDTLTQAVAALRANTVGAQLTARVAEHRVLRQAKSAVSALLKFDVELYNTTLTTRVQLSLDLDTFRTELFAAADLPADPDDTWSAFVEAANTYHEHLGELGVDDVTRCLYCRQPLAEAAQRLLAKYSVYLDDKISADIRKADRVLADSKRYIESIEHGEISSFAAEFENREDRPSFYPDVVALNDLRKTVTQAAGNTGSIDVDLQGAATNLKSAIDTAAALAADAISELEDQVQDRKRALSETQEKLLQMKDNAELAKSWPGIETHVGNAKQADQLRILKRTLPPLNRSVTELAKTASDQMINQSFDALFIEECEALRAPQLKVQFVGREGKAQRRKVLRSVTKLTQPSKVLSEGEQKVLAMADFLAEARLAGITAPVIFDDPVSSLDHRRINEVAERIALLSQSNQVIVFTHDIFFATTLLALVDKSKRFAYFHVTDDGGKGQVARATGPRSDTLKWFKAEINRTIEAAKSLDGEARHALIRQGYSLLRSWCEVFTETELLRGVSKRYQPNVTMGKLTEINISTLPEIIPKIEAIFEVSCRYTDAHSQPLATLAVSATLSGLEDHWNQAQELKAKNDT